jgi:hypothetical protein
VRKPEQLLWDWLRNRMNGHWFAQRVENTVGVGQPDVYFSTPTVRGWIELKSIPRWPAKPLAPFALPNWTSEQRNWMEQHAKFGARAWLLVGVQETNEVVLLPDRLALSAVDHWSSQTLRLSAHTKSRRTYGAGTLLADLSTEML